AADTSDVADVPDASEAPVLRAWPWSSACVRSEVAAPVVATATAAASRPLPLPLSLPEALASVAAAAIGVWSAVAGVDVASDIVGVGLSCTDAKASGVPAASCVDHCVPAALDVVDALA